MGIRSDYSLLINQILGYLLVYGPTVNTILELSTVIVNFLHLIILFQKPLRSSSIFILMIGICISDILAFLTLFLFIGEDRVSWYRSLLSTLRYSGFEMTLCLPPGYKSLSLIGLTKVIILNSSRPISIWLAIQMAFLRTLSIVFPMNETVQKMGKATFTISMATVICLFWILYYSWELVFVKIWWFPDHIIRNCWNPEKARKLTVYLLVLDPTSLAFTLKRESWEFLVRLVPTILYPLFTVSLIIELWRIRKRRKSKDTDPTFLILFMTLSFMLSEGLVGVANCLEYGCIRDPSVDVKDYSESFSQVLVNLRSFNALSHAFVCFGMSSQYRGTVAKMICVLKPKIIKVKTRQSTFFKLQSRTL